MQRRIKLAAPAMELQAGGENEASCSPSLPPPAKPTVLTMGFALWDRKDRGRSIENGSILPELGKALQDGQHFVRIRKKIIGLRTKRKKKDFLSQMSSQGQVTL